VDPLARYGRFLRLGEDDLRWAESWFARYGMWGNLIGHALPGIRSVISFAAGIGRMDVKRYVVTTAIGSAAWNLVLAAAGYYLLDRWFALAKAMGEIDVLLLLGVVLAAAGVVYWRRRSRTAA